MPQLRGHKGDRYLSWFTSCLAPPLGSLENTELLFPSGRRLQLGLLLFPGAHWGGGPGLYGNAGCPWGCDLPLGREDWRGEPYSQKNSSRSMFCLLVWHATQELGKRWQVPEYRMYKKMRAVLDRKPQTLSKCQFSLTQLLPDAKWILGLGRK